MPETSSSAAKCVQKKEAPGAWSRRIPAAAAEAASLAPLEPAGGSAGFARRTGPLGRSVRAGHLRATGIRAPGLSHPAFGSALGSSAAGASETPERASSAGAGLRQAARRSGDPVLRPHRRICRSIRRVTGGHRTASKPSVATLCRPAEGDAPTAPTRRSHEPRANIPIRAARPQARARARRKISVHKDARHAQIIPGFSPQFSTRQSRSEPFGIEIAFEKAVSVDLEALEAVDHRVPQVRRACTILPQRPGS